MKRSGYTSDKNPTGHSGRARLSRIWPVCLAMVLALASPVTQANASVHVLFSFGKVEVLRAGASDWQFLRSRTELENSDLVRMPPVSLLRLGVEEGDSRSLLTGVHQARVDALLAEAQAAPNGAAPSGTGEAEVSDLPIGDPMLATRHAEVPLRIGSADRARWLSNEWASDPRVQEAARRAVNQGSPDARHGTAVLATLERLHAAARKMLMPGAAIRRSFGDDPSAHVILLAALIEAAGLPSERITLRDGTPILLVRSELPQSSAALLTANRDLLHVGVDGALYLPVQPTSRTTSFLEAWYRGGAATGVAVTEDRGPLP